MLDSKALEAMDDNQGMVGGKSVPKPLGKTGSRMTFSRMGIVLPR
jgi:hypothetical protein